MKSFETTLNIGEHILALPLDKEYLLDELFDSSLTGSFIEKLNPNGTFSNKEKILFENNEFVVSETNKVLKPFETIRLTLKRDVVINWEVAFKSNSHIKSEEVKISQGYDKNISLQFMKLRKYDEEINKEIVVLIFQGSQEAEDWMTNIGIKKANYFGKEKVHKGFYESMRLFLKTVKDREFETKDKKRYSFNKDIDFINKNCKLILAGHSLGGAIATLAGCYFNDLGVKKENMSIYTFGAPPVGSKEFCQNYNEKLNIFRVVNEKDIVPKIDKITNLRHLGKEIKLESNEQEVHSCSGYIDNLIDSIENRVSI